MEKVLEGKVVRGIPTKIDVDKLLARFEVPEENQLILWEELEQLLNLHRRDYRFRTVTTAWRRKLERDHDVLLYAVPGVGLSVADANTKIDIAARRLQLNDANSGRWVGVAYKTNTSSLDEARRDTQARILTKYSAFLTLSNATKPKHLPIP